MTNLHLHAASGTQLYKELAQPHVETFSEVFEAWATWDPSTKRQRHTFEPRTITGQAIADNLWHNVKATMKGGRHASKHPDQTMQIGPFCSRRDGNSLSVRCADWVLSRIRERAIIIGGDRMSFELTDHDNGWTLVTANHGSICGNVWLAYIRTTTIPTTSNPPARA